MAEYVIHQHHHYGWTMNTYEADSAEEAMMMDLLKSHEWLPEYGHKVEFIPDKQRYAVYFDGPPYPGAFRGIFAYDGGYWFGDQMRIGAPDDCAECGGTGVNHYNPFCKCWKCDDIDKTRKYAPHDTPGVGSGKAGVRA